MKKILLTLQLLVATFFVHAQNVGIGTTTPLANLHIRNGLAGVNPFFSTFLAVESNANTYINLLAPAVNENAILFGHPGNAANGVIMYNNPSTPNGFQFRNNGNLTRMTIANNGNMGIGLLSANAKLSVSATGTELAGTAASSTFRTHAGSLGTALGSEINLGSIGFSSTNSSSLGIRAYRYAAGSDWTTTALVLGYDVDNTVRAGSFLTMSANSNIGIGIANPLAKLHVYANDASLALFGPNSFGGQLYVGAGTNQNVTQTAQVIASDGNLHIDPAAGKNIYLGYFQPRDIYINPLGGKVGIGNSNPAYQLDLSNRMRIRSGGNNSISAGLWLNNNANTEAAFIGMEDDTHVGFFGSGSGWRFGMNTQTGALKINGSEGTAGQVLKSNGSGQTAEWSNPLNALYNNMTEYTQSGTLTASSFDNLHIPGMSNISLVISSTSKVVFSSSVDIKSNPCFGCGGSTAETTVQVNFPGGSAQDGGSNSSNIDSDETKTFVTGMKMYTFTPGTYTINVILSNNNFGGPTITATYGRLEIIVIAQ